MRRASAPHSLWHFERAASFARDLGGDARVRLDELLRRTGGTALMTMRLSRQLKRENCSLVIA
jgi:ribosomal protein S19E (S16A)